LPEDRTADLLLVTRPEPGATETASRLAALGLRPLVAPLLTIVPKSARLPPAAGLQAVLATSGNALPALAIAHRGVRLLAVGDATAARARAGGFTDVHSAGRDAAALATLAAALCDPAGGPLLLAAGAGQGRGLAAALRAAGFAVVRREVYAACPPERLPEAARAALAAGRVRAALFYSAATARAFAALLGPALPPASLADVEALAISPATAAALTPLPWRRIRVASAPNQDAMLALMA